MTFHRKYKKNMIINQICHTFIQQLYSMKVCLILYSSLQTAQQTADGGLSYETVLNGNSIYHVTKPWSVGMGRSEMRSL